MIGVDFGLKWRTRSGDIHRDMEISSAMVFMTPQLDLPCLEMRLYLAGLAGPRIEKAAFLWRGKRGMIGLRYGG